MKWFLIVLLLQSMTFIGQDNFLNAVKWQGDLDDFTQEKERVRLEGSSGKSSIFYDTVLLCGTVSFQFGLNFAPSASNQFRFYMMEDTSAKKGIELRVGANGTEDGLEVRDAATGALRKQLLGGRLGSSFDSLLVELVIAGDSILISAFLGDIKDTVRIAVRRLRFTQIECRYTKTRADQFYFDFYQYLAIDSLCKPMSPEEVTVPKVEEELEIDSKPAIEQGGLKHGDILITELMIDPSPVRLLPASEYLEIYNNTKESVDLGTLYIELNGTAYPLPQSILEAGAYTVMSKDSVAQWLKIERFSNLNNERFDMVLRGSDGALLHDVRFDKSNYSLSTGGISLELQNMEQFCYASSFGYSSDFKGGTPGAINSSSKVNTKGRLLLQTEEYLWWSVPVLVEDSVWGFAQQTTSDFPSRYCDGTLIDTIMTAASFESQPLPQLVFKEVLSNPIDDCPEFIELQNTGVRAVSSSIILEVDKELVVLPAHLRIPANGFIVVTPNYITFDKCYDLPNNATLVQVSFPDLKISEQSLRIMSRDGGVIDEVLLAESMHFIDDDKEGYSLEKYRKGWTSCVDESKSSPGRFTDVVVKGKPFILNKELIYDLHRRTLVVDLAFSDFESELSIVLYDRLGRKVEDLLVKTRLTKNEIVLEPRTNKVGFYTLYFERSDKTGSITVYKAPLVIKK